MCITVAGEGEVIRNGNPKDKEYSSIEKIRLQK